MIIYFEKLNSDAKYKSFSMCQSVLYFVWYDFLNTTSLISKRGNDIVYMHSGRKLKYKLYFIIYKLYIYNIIKIIFIFYVRGCFASVYFFVQYA